MGHATEIDPAIAKLQDELRAKGVKYVIGAYVDIHGAQKAKVVPIDHLPQMAAGSERYTGYALDGLGQAPNEDELASVPDFSQLIQLPWESKLAWCPADLTFQGQPYPLSTRVALKTVMAEAEAMGFGFNLGIECEIFLLKQEADGSLHTPIPDDKLVKPCYDVRGFVDNFTWLDKVATTINDLGWDLYSFDHEDACGQFEFDFNYADALTMCDRLTFFRMMAKHYAKEEGLIATMMPKPFADRTGNGAHFNMSLSDKETGKNIFACDPSADPRGLGLTETGYYFIGGVLKHGRALCAAFAPTVNSYKRLVRQGSMAGFSWAPVFNSYGSNNRTNSCACPPAADAARAATPTARSTPTSPPLSSWRPVSRVSVSASIRVPPTRTTSTTSPTPSAPNAASSSCPRPSPRRWTPSPPTRWWRRPWARRCATSSSATSAPSGRSITSRSVPGRSSAIATFSRC